MGTAPAARRRARRSAASSCTPAANRRSPASPTTRPSAPAFGPERTRTQSSSMPGQLVVAPPRTRAPAGPTRARRRDPRAARAGQRPASGSRRRTVPSSTRTAERRRAGGARPLPALRGAEVTQLLARQRRDDDPAHAHRAGAGERLGVDPRPDDEDAAGPADVDAARAQLAERVGRELEAATGRRSGGERAAQRPARRADADLRARAGRRSRRRRSVTTIVSRCSPVTMPPMLGLAGHGASSSPSSPCRPPPSAGRERGAQRPPPARARAVRAPPGSRPRRRACRAACSRSGSPAATVEPRPRRAAGRRARA